MESRGNPRRALIGLFELEEMFRRVINERAMVYGKDSHPKHELTQYHKFFVDNISDGEMVLDVGCGKGIVAYQVAMKMPRCRVVGIDRNECRLAEARNRNDLNNLCYVLSDVCKNPPSGKYDVVILSNILEHIERRIEFLLSLVNNIRPRRILIRVPAFERDWTMQMKKELGVNFFSDPEHFIEHTLAELRHEVESAGLKIQSETMIWGEIWMRCENDR